MLSNYPAWYFLICNFSICVIFIRRCQTCTIYGLWRKVRYQNVHEKIPQKSVLILSPNYNQRCEIMAPIQVRTFLRCVHVQHNDRIQVIEYLLHTHLRCNEQFGKVFSLSDSLYLRFNTNPKTLPIKEIVGKHVDAIHRIYRHAEAKPNEIHRNLVHYWYAKWSKTWIAVNRS